MFWRICKVEGNCSESSNSVRSRREKNKAWKKENSKYFKRRTFSSKLMAKVTWLQRSLRHVTCGLCLWFTYTTYTFPRWPERLYAVSGYKVWTSYTFWFPKINPKLDFEGINPYSFIFFIVVKSLICLSQNVYKEWRKYEKIRQTLSIILPL